MHCNLNTTNTAIVSTSIQNERDFIDVMNNAKLLWLVCGILLFAICCVCCLFVLYMGRAQYLINTISKLPSITKFISSSTTCTDISDDTKTLTSTNNNNHGNNKTVIIKQLNIEPLSSSDDDDINGNQSPQIMNVPPPSPNNSVSTATTLYKIVLNKQDEIELNNNVNRIIHERKSIDAASTGNGKKVHPLESIGESIDVDQITFITSSHGPEYSPKHIIAISELDDDDEHSPLPQSPCSHLLSLKQAHFVQSSMSTLPTIPNEMGEEGDNYDVDAESSDTEIEENEQKASHLDKYILKKDNINLTMIENDFIIKGLLNLQQQRHHEINMTSSTIWTGETINNLNYILNNLSECKSLKSLKSDTMNDIDCEPSVIKSSKSSLKSSAHNDIISEMITNVDNNNKQYFLSK